MKIDEAQSKPSKLREYKDLGTVEQFMVDCFACYWSPSRIAKGITDQFGEAEELKTKAVQSFKLRNESLILSRRKEIGNTIPIMNPTARYEMAQEIYDMSMEGAERVTKGGVIVKIKDPKTAVMALTLAHNMSAPKELGVVTDDDIIRKVVQETFEDLKKKNPKMTSTDIANIMMDEMDENAKPYIEELETIQ